MVKRWKMNKSRVVGGLVSVAYVRGADHGFESHRAHNFLPLQTERENKDGPAQRRGKGVRPFTKCEERGA